jgi:hypothetical protein
MVLLLDRTRDVIDTSFSFVSNKQAVLIHGCRNSVRRKSWLDNIDDSKITISRARLHVQQEVFWDSIIARFPCISSHSS